MFNPSTWNRYDFFEKLKWSLDSRGDMFSTFFNDFKYYFITVGILLIIYIIRMIYNYKLKKQPLQIKDSLILNIILYILSFVSFAVLLFSPYYITRALLIISFTSIVMIVYLLNELIGNNIFKLVIGVMSSFVIIFYCVYIRNIFIDYNKFDNIRNELIVEQLSNKNLDKLIIPLYDKYPDSRIIALVEKELCTNDIVKEKYYVDDDIKILCLYNYAIR